MPWWKIILAPIMVFTSSQITTGIGIVVFIVLIGGTFLILDRSGVLKYIMSSVVRKFEKKKYLLLAVIVFVCMMMSSVVGVLEESLTLVRSRSRYRWHSAGIRSSVSASAWCR